MNFQRVLILRCIQLLVLAMLLGACTNPELVCEDRLGCVTVLPNEPIRIGYLLAESGAAAFLGEDSRGGIELAIDDRENGTLDHQIELVGEDTGCDSVKGQTAAQTLTAVSTIVGIIGTNCSTVTESVMPIIDNAGLVLLSPSNTSPNLTTDQTWRGAYARTAPINLRQADIAAAFAYDELGGRTAAILHDGSDYTRGFAQAFATTWRSLGGVVSFENEIAIGQTELNDILTDLSISMPDILYMSLFEPEANIIANTLQGVPDLEATILIGSDYLLTATFPQSAGEAVNGLYLTGTAVSGDEYNIFLAKWDVKFGGSPPASYHAHAYDATNILLNAIESVAQKSTKGTLLIGRLALRQAIAETTNYAGLTGNLTCNDVGDCASNTTFGIYQVTEAEIAGEVWPPPLIWPRSE